MKSSIWMISEINQRIGTSSLFKTSNTFRKQEKIAIESREQGNKFFNAKRFVDSEASYTKVLSFTIKNQQIQVILHSAPKSELQSLGYANRGASLYNQKKFERAIADCSLVCKFHSNSNSRPSNAIITPKTSVTKCFTAAANAIWSFLTLKMQFKTLKPL